MAVGAGRASNRNFARVGTMNLNPAVQTAKYAKSAKREELGREAQFTVRAGIHLFPRSCAFAFFAFFAVPSALLGNLTQSRVADGNLRLRLVHVLLAPATPGGLRG